MTITNYMVFQISFKGYGEIPPPQLVMKILLGVKLFIGLWKSKEKWFWLFEPFLNLKATFYKYWTSIKFKISMTCVYKEYEVKT